MKTNQFNLTTKRYTEADIQNFINNNDFNIFAFHASDKFGEYGLTGLSIIKFDYKNKSCEIDTLLMSCRIIGRNLEYAFFDFIVDNLKKQRIKTIKAEYKETLKKANTTYFIIGVGINLIKSPYIKDYPTTNLL